ncbi:glutathione S-transferase family protein [Maricaulis salignorans]|uniref:Glutathione S-transferase n=1 Tax=Maricaulis salignorans TaxID=144026 RepID=A0A1G9MTT1_9PROT|nr:glutathione S-transferase family protein [Maricaulis salignorans]SDL77716.1 glutathione S-transferase [Maricaulis salignorans]
MDRPVLHIGNKQLSSWSLRPWLALRKAGIAFDEHMIPLDRPESRAALEAASPGGTVPVLETGGVAIWDSLAICEWAAERNPILWPADPDIRGQARSVTAAMHSGYSALRNACPMDLRRTAAPVTLDDAVRRDVVAIQAVWAAVRRSGDGPFLFGRWSIADAFYTPVAARFHHFAIELDPASQAYCDTLLADEDYRDWFDAAQREDLLPPGHSHA